MEQTTQSERHLIEVDMHKKYILPLHLKRWMKDLTHFCQNEMILFFLSQSGTGLMEDMTSVLDSRYYDAGSEIESYVRDEQF
jgi:hypothetical protein